MSPSTITASFALHTRVALSAIAFNTDLVSEGELAMTRRISLVAFSRNCPSASSSCRVSIFRSNSVSLLEGACFCLAGRDFSFRLRTFSRPGVHDKPPKLRRRTVRLALTTTRANERSRKDSARHCDQPKRRIKSDTPLSRFTTLSHPQYR